MPELFHKRLAYRLCDDGQIKYREWTIADDLVFILGEHLLLEDKVYAVHAREEC